MRIKLFGAPSVWRDDRQLTGALAQRRRLALVSALAVMAPPGRPAVSRERILALLWPGDDEERARAALSQALYAVRRELGADDAIVGTGDLRLNPDRVTCDYWDFLQAIAEGADAAAAGLRTAPLLDGLDIPEAREFEFWSEEARREADRLWSAAAGRAAERAERDGDLPRTVELRRALANADPLSSRTAVDLARALARAGDREAALRHLRVHAALVEQELEAAPAAEVLALTQALQRGEVPPAPVTRERDAATPPPAPPVVAAAPPAATVEAPDTPAATPPRGPRHLAWVAVAAVAVLAVVAFARRDRGTTATTDAGTVVLAVGAISGDSLGETVGGMLATNLARGDGVVVVSSARMQELAAVGTGAGGALAAARKAGATELVEGALLREAGTYRLELRRVEVARGTLRGAVRAEGADVFSLVDRASATLLESMARVGPTTSVADVSTRSLEAWRLYEAALRNNAAGRTDAARAQLRGALAADSTFAIAALTLGYLLPGGSDESRAFLAQAFRMRDRASPRDALLIRVAWFTEMNDPAAAAVMDTLAARFPDDLEVRMNIAGPALFQRADFTRALSVLTSVWNADSIRIGQAGGGRCYACEVPQHITTVAEHMDSLALAERWLRRYLALAPDDVLAWDRLAGVLERDVTRHAEMAEVVARAVRLGHTESQRHLLVAATRRADTLAFRRAEALLDAPATERATADAWNRTILYRNAGRLDDAMREARIFRREQLRRRNSGTPAAVLEALVHLERGEGRRAAAIFDSIADARLPGESASARARRVVWNRTLAATARFEAGDTAGLAALADTLAVLGPRSYFVRDHYLHHHVRGLAWLARGRTDEAIAELRRAIVFPSQGFTRSNWHLARALVAAGRPAEARRWLEAAARAPRDASPLYLNPVTVRDALRRLP